MFAVIKTGGKQYLVKKGDTLKIEKIKGEAIRQAQGEKGGLVKFAQVLLVADEAGKKVEIGKPLIQGAKVEAKIIEQGRGKKITVIKYKPKIRYRRKRGHRQLYTKVEITKLPA